MPHQKLYTFEEIKQKAALKSIPKELHTELTFESIVYNARQSLIYEITGGTTLRLFRVINLYTKATKSIEKSSKSEEYLQKAASLCERICEQEPRNALVHDFFGRILTHLDRPVEAITHLKRAVKLDPNDFFYHFNLGYVNSTITQSEEAIEEYKKAIPLASDQELSYQILPHKHLSLELLSLERYEEALESLQKWIELTPENILALNLLGRAYIETDRFLEAKKVINKVLALEPTDDIANCNYGIICNLLGDPNRAMIYLENVLAMEPDHEIAHINYGTSLIQTGRYDEAIEHLSLENKSESNLPMVHARLGNVYRLMGRSSEAEENYHKALTKFHDKTGKKSYDYKPAILAERGLLKIAAIKDSPIEQEALQRGLVTTEKLAQWYKVEQLD
jgi:tetratricopeptide (TPR) repeat protein